MRTQIHEVALGDVVVFVPEIFEDARGFFYESFRSDRFAALGLPDHFVQDNHSGSRRHVVRGLHFQWDPPMGKLMRVTHGEAFLVAVDLRLGSPTFGRWHGAVVSERDRRQIWAPAGFARGFCALSDWAEIQYKCTALYNPRGEGGIRWDDPEIGIEWPVARPILSDKDRDAPSLREWLARPEAQALRWTAPQARVAPAMEGARP